jgi:phosphoribosylformylglycinamidine synthase
VAVFACEVLIRPRADILDPQGDAVGKALEHLGFQGAAEVNVGRYLTLRLEAADKASAVLELNQMCEKLLANPITEDYELKVSEV